MMKAPTKLFYEFGEFRLDAEKHRLLREGEIVALTPKAVETLTVLVRQPGRVVERDELMNSVWRDVAVEDGNLTVTVSMLRKALGENGNGRKFIETVPRLGYKFVADVREVFEEVPTLVVEKQTLARLTIDEEIGLNRRASTMVSGLLGSHRQAVGWTVSAAIIGLAIVTFALFRPWKSTPAIARTTSIKSIAVLPFKAINSDKENSHQGLGMADILITRLSNLRGINVRPTSAVMSFENLDEDSLSIAKKLRVDAVLEGTIYRTGEKVRISGRLIKVSDQSVIWSGQFEKLRQDELSLQNEIAAHVADALALHLSSDEERALNKHYTENADAYQLYVRGRYEWNKRNYGGLAEAQRLFRNAIEKDPDFALAYVGLADSLVLFNESEELNYALKKALELDPNSAEVYATLGFHRAIHHWLWSEAEASFKKSIELNPGYATAHHWYAILLEIEGRNEEARAEMQRALEINPMSYNFLADMGQIYYFNREYDKAKDYSRKALEIYPDFVHAHEYLRDIHLQTGEYEAAIEEWAKEQNDYLNADHRTNSAAQEKSSNLPLYRELYRQGGIAKLLKYVITSSEKDMTLRNNQNTAFLGARIYAFLGDKEKALEHLERAYENRAFMLAWVKADPIFDSVRSEPRYQAVLKKMGL